MLAKEGVLELLNRILTTELTALHQYLAHAALCGNWGYERLHHEIHERAREEFEHAEDVAEHILYLEGAPDMQRLGTLTIGQTVHDQFTNDLTLEQGAVQLLREAIAHCHSVGDFTTRHKLEDMVVDSEEHVDWIETQLRAMAQVGVENYLAEQIKKGHA